MLYLNLPFSPYLNACMLCAGPLESRGDQFWGANIPKLITDTETANDAEIRRRAGSGPKNDILFLFAPVSS